MLDMASKFHIISKFVIDDLNRILHRQCAGMVMIYPYTKYHIPNFNGSLMTVTELNANNNFCSHYLLFYILKKKYHNKSFIFV
jgi:hypothetical protein